MSRASSLGQIESRSNFPLKSYIQFKLDSHTPSFQGTIHLLLLIIIIDICRVHLALWACFFLCNLYGHVCLMKLSSLDSSIYTKLYMQPKSDA